MLSDSEQQPHQQPQHPDGQPPSALVSHKNRADSLAVTLYDWRKILVRLDAVLLWEQPAALVALLAVVTVKFLLIWWFQPPLISMLAIACLVAVTCDLLVPHASQLLLPSEWSPADEGRYSDICSRLVHSWDCLAGNAELLACWRRDRPQLYLGVIVLTLLVLIILGEKFNNLFLAYTCALGLLLAPGMRRSRLPQRTLGKLLGWVRGRKAD